LLDAGDTEGACSRAYYAMFDAAHAALRAKQIETPNAAIKTHNGLLAIFGTELVLTKQVSADLHKALNRVQELRHVADYTADPPDMEKARHVSGYCSRFRCAAIATQGISMMFPARFPVLRENPIPLRENKSGRTCW